MLKLLHLERFFVAVHDVVLRKVLPEYYRRVGCQENENWLLKLNIRVLEFNGVSFVGIEVTHCFDHLEPILVRHLEVKQH